MATVVWALASDQLGSPGSASGESCPPHPSFRDMARPEPEEDVVTRASEPGRSLPADRQGLRTWPRPRVPALLALLCATPKVGEAAAACPWAGHHPFIKANSTIKICESISAKGRELN